MVTPFHHWGLGQDYTYYCFSFAWSIAIEVARVACWVQGDRHGAEVYVSLMERNKVLKQKRICKRFLRGECEGGVQILHPPERDTRLAANVQRDSAVANQMGANPFGRVCRNFASSFVSARLLS